MKIFVSGTSSSIGYINTLLDATSSRKGSYIPLEHFTNDFGNKIKMRLRVMLRKRLLKTHTISQMTTSWIFQNICNI